MEKIEDRFLRYVAIETTSDENVETVPSSRKELDLARLLYKELQEMGIEAYMDEEHGFVFGYIHNNNGKRHPCIGLLAHMDTHPDASGANIKPKKTKYEGQDIVLNEELGIKLSPRKFPFMDMYKGQTFITTDGTTLLGADDKAGIAAIMSLAEYITENPDFKHGELRVGFTPDEEIGTGVELFDVKKFDADYAYTVDGGTEGEIEYENFNAFSLTVNVHGTNTHPGYSKDVMVNAVRVAMEYDSLLPEQKRPEYTEGYDGFFHAMNISGNVSEVCLKYALRDHDEEKMAKMCDIAKAAADYLNKKYGEGTVEAIVKEDYKNMREMIAPHMFLIDNLKEATIEAGVEPIVVPVRGGTDGASLSFMGLPCPNMGNGDQNAHGIYECITIEALEKTFNILKNLVQKF